MGKTAAERKRESRAKQSEEKKLEERKKAREKMKSLREKRKFNAEYQVKHKEQSRIGMEKMRQRKKDMNEVRETLPFASPQTLGKALKRVSQALPNSPKKRKAIVKELAMKEGIFHKLNSDYSTETKQGLAYSTISLVQDFYKRDEISRHLPGKKDFKCIKNKETGKKEKVQKRLLLYTLKEAHDIFRKDYPENPIGLSKFCELRPEEVHLVSNKDHRVCCCVYCENLSILLIACNFNDKPKKIKELIEMIVCDTKSADCMINQVCEKCSLEEKLNDVIKCSNSWNDMDVLKFNQWEKGNLVPQEYEWKEVKKMLLKQTAKILKHFYNINRQAAELQKQKEDLLPGEIILQSDFSENYTIKHQDEIMQAHWNTAQTSGVTIYTAVIYYREVPFEEIKVQCYAVISDTNKHSSSEVYIFNEEILKDFELLIRKKIKSVTLWTDGAAAHFKNRFSMVTLSSSNLYKSWNFTESYHGKGPHDGVGAVIKRNVWQRVLRNQSVILSSTDFFNEASQIVSNVKCLHVLESCLDNKRKQIEQLFNDVLPVVGIQAARCAKNMGQFQIQLFQNTGDKTPISKTIQLKKVFAETNTAVSNVSIGDFIVVDIYNKKSKQQYVGQITDQDANDYEVLFMKKGIGFEYVFPEKDDKAWIEKTQIIQVLQQPNMNARGHYQFIENIKTL